MPMILNPSSTPPSAASSQVVGRTSSPPFRAPLRSSRSSSASKPTVEYVGVFRREVFSNADGFKIIKLEDGTTVKLNDLHNSLTSGLTYRFSGYWQDNHKYNTRDFNAQHFTVDQPTNQNGIIGFLSKMCAGIGPFIARQIYDKFGAESVEVVRSSPEKVSEAGILEHQKALKASECLQSKDDMEKTKIALNEIFQGHGFSSSAIDKSIKLWGCDAPAVIRRDPFKLMVAGVRGAGYTRCDKLYQSLHLPAGRVKRQMLAIWYKLKTNRDGHTWVSAASLGVMPTKAIALGLRSRWIEMRDDSAGQKWYADGDKAKDERELARHIRRLMRWKASSGDVNKPLWPDVEAIEGLGDHQRTALAAVLISTVCTLNGKPGTGKTWSVAKLCKLLIKLFGLQDVGVCAPTGKAARRVQENLVANGCSGIEAKTIHSMFGLSINSEDEDLEQVVVNDEGEPEPKQVPRFIIVDEVSMQDASVACRMFAKLPTGTHVLLVGDVNQLPPVGHGSPLRDILRSKAVPSGELSEIRRNSGMIVTACHQIANGEDFDVAAKYNPETGDNLRYLESNNSADTVDGVAKIHTLLPGYGFDAVNDCQVIAALNSKGGCSKNAINIVLQDALNPTGKKIDGKKFRVRDKVIYTKNMDLMAVDLPQSTKRGEKWPGHEAPESYHNTGGKYRVANGDIGRVVAIDEKCTIVRFDAPQRVVRLTRDVECYLDLAYVVSCHKYQGSESPVVVVVLDPAAGTVCSREWIYTAISRAKQLCILVGPAGLAEKFCQKKSIDRRKTFLAQLLKANTLSRPITAVHCPAGSSVVRDAGEGFLPDSNHQEI